jgi:hypothetical protein
MLRLAMIPGRFFLFCTPVYTLKALGDFRRPGFVIRDVTQRRRSASYRRAANARRRFHARQPCPSTLRRHFDRLKDQGYTHHRAKSERRLATMADAERPLLIRRSVEAVRPLDINSTNVVEWL